MKNAAQSIERVAATKEAGASFREGIVGGGTYTVTCYDKDGNLKWESKAKNLVVNEGLQDMNTKYFKGSTYTAAWYLGLVTDPPTFAAGDTLASHAGWTEFTNYSGNRKAVTFGTATTADPSVIDNNSSQASFSITGTATIAGAFLTNVDTGTSGILFSEAEFESPGDRSVVSGDTLNVKYEFSLGDA
jgi:hypothetical protein